MKHLAEYMYKDVEVITNDGQIFIGTVRSWDSAVTNKEDNNIDEISIDILYDGTYVAIYEREIKSIREL